jgi:Fe-Mn family superoxide dismutase
MSYTVPALPYAFEALEPHIDAQTMQIHHGKHHQAYVDKLNAALPEVLKAQPEFEGVSIETILCNLDKVPESVRTAVRNNGGGHYNHSLFWESMSAQGGGEPTGELAEAINSAFGSFAEFQTKFAEAATTRFGSGWAWLIKKDNSLAIVSTANQDNPIIDDMTVMPLLGLDVWEHAYYLKYQNRRPDYISAWWNVVDWDKVAERFAA